MAEPAARPSRPPRKPVTLDVLRSTRLTPHLIRVVLGGPGLAELQPQRLHRPLREAGLPATGPVVSRAVRCRGRPFLPQEERPLVRTYTVRSFDADAGELAIDFVYHGDEGVAGPWAAQARPGQQLQLLGPGGGYAPDPAADWHLLIGDEAAFPAIASALAEIPEHATVIAVLEMGEPEDATYLDVPERADVRWLVRGRDASLVDTVEALEFPAGTVQAFVHGELAAVRLLRKHLLDERKLPADRVSISGYWRHGKDEDGFQAEKRDDAQRVAS